MRELRVALVGSESDRRRLRSRLDEGSIEIAGEFDTTAAAEASGIAFDAILVGARSPSSAPADGEAAVVEPLTAREVQVLELLAEGLSNKRIAERLRISDQTVKFHVSSISGKLGAANRTDSVRRAVRRGLITL
jgi:DNA-binding NarL/FixJ family response regulator